MFNIIWKSLNISKDTCDEVVEELNRKISHISTNRIPYLKGRALSKEMAHVQELREQRDNIVKKYGTATASNSAPVDEELVEHILDNENDLTTSSDESEDTNKDVGVATAGPVPASLLSRQDLEGGTTETETKDIGRVFGASMNYDKSVGDDMNRNLSLITLHMDRIDALKAGDDKKVKEIDEKIADFERTHNNNNVHKSKKLFHVYIYYRGDAQEHVKEYDIEANTKEEAIAIGKKKAEQEEGPETFGPYYYHTRASAIEKSFITKQIDSILKKYE